jgi:hypothetical protein
MGVIIIVPKRKMLKPQSETTQPDVISPPSSVVIPPQLLSTLIVDTNKGWQGFSIENIGSPSSNLGAARAYDLLAAITFVIDGGGSVITTGQKGHLRLPFAGTIISAALAADQVGSIVIDIWKDTTVNFPPTVADTITASAKPTLSSAQSSLDAVLTGWTKTFASGDYLAFNVDSVATITRVTLTLIVRRT